MTTTLLCKKKLVFPYVCRAFISQLSYVKTREQPFPTTRLKGSVFTMKTQLCFPISQMVLTTRFFSSYMDNRSFTSVTRVTTPTLPYTISKRGMLSSKSVQVARAAYYCLNSLTSPEVIDKTTKNNHTTLAESLVDLSLDHSKGVTQHKTTIVKHITNHRFGSDAFYDYYKTYNPKLSWEPHTQTDLRVLNELPVIQEYTSKFGSSIEWILATADSRPANFPHQIQSNQDFWVMLSTGLNKTLNFGYKCVPQDEKSGKDMFRHTTRGSLGLLTYDQDGNNVQVSSEPARSLIEFNTKRLRDIKQGLESDIGYDLAKEFNPIFDKCTTYLNSNKSEFEIHDAINDELWTSLQCNPLYTRSISFIFTKQVDYAPLTGREEAFRNHFVSLLGDKLYNLDNRGHCREVYKAMLIAYKSQVDSKIVDKLHHLHHQAGITLNTHFLHEVANLIKHGLI